jgi:hypothetical protein
MRQGEVYQAGVNFSQKRYLEYKKNIRITGGLAPNAKAEKISAPFLIRW